MTGQAVDTAVLIVVAFGGLQPPAMLLRMIISAYLIKVAIEVVATPLTYLVVGCLNEPNRMTRMTAGRTSTRSYSGRKAHDTP